MQSLFLACAIFSIPLPVEKPGASLENRQSNFVRDSIVYLAKSGVTPNGMKDLVVGEQTLVVPAQAIAPAFQSFFATLSSQSDPLNSFERLTSQEYAELYLKARAHRHPSFLVPETKKELEQTLGLEKLVFNDSTPQKWVPDTTGKWLRKIVPVSVPKGRERVLYRPQAAHPLFGTGKPKISIAVAGEETEVTLQREDGSGDWDYYPYGPDGRLAVRAEFITSHQTLNEGTAPHTCMACHYSVSARRFKGIR